jgi:hypothetical protein
MRIIVGNNDRGAAVLLQDGEDVLEEIEPQCQCGSHLLVLAQKLSRLMKSDSLDDSTASFTRVTMRS